MMINKLKTKKYIMIKIKYQIKMQIQINKILKIIKIIKRINKINKIIILINKIKT